MSPMLPQKVEEAVTLPSAKSQAEEEESTVSFVSSKAVLVAAMSAYIKKEELEAFHCPAAKSQAEEEENTISVYVPHQVELARVFSKEVFVAAMSE